MSGKGGADPALGCLAVFMVLVLLAVGGWAILILAVCGNGLIERSGKAGPADSAGKRAARHAPRKGARR